MVKVLVTGATGQVGRELVKLAPAGFDVVAMNSEQLDLTNNHQVQQVILQKKPALIMNAAAYTAVDKAESDAQRAYAVNEAGVTYLAEAAAVLNIPLFHISTDYVFSGASKIPYKEDDAVGPTGVYGASKLAGELALANAGIPYIILRTSWVFSAEGNNFVKTMLRLGKERDTLGVVADQYGCPTSAASIATVLWQLAEQYTSQKALPWGVYHFSNAPVCSWHEFSGEIFKQAVEIRALSAVPSVNEITSCDYPTPAKRPAWSVMDCTKIETLLGKPVPDWRTELATVLRQLQS